MVEQSLYAEQKLQDKYEKELDELHAAFELERDEFEDQLAALSQAFEKRGSFKRYITIMWKIS